MPKGKLLISGIAASKGIGVGTVYVVGNDLDKHETIKDGDIVVVTSFMLSHEQYLKRGRAFVWDFGGMGSKGAKICREWGHPCVAGTVDGTTVLEDGQKVNSTAASGTNA